MNDTIKKKLDLLTEEPGSYQMKDSEGNIIYVGKAKNLKKRVSSYFLRPVTGKTALLVNDICDFDHIVTNSEKEAFLLELNLIRQYLPKYNILLKDDRHYPYIELTKGEYPYLRIARKINKKEGKYYGPYSDSSAAYEVINLLNQIYPLRKCKTLPKKECLYYHTGQCCGPCVNKIDNYDEIVSKVVSFLNGNNGEVRSELVSKMKEASDKLEFEVAMSYKKMIDYIDHINQKQSVEYLNEKECDIFGYHTKDGYISFATLLYRNGNLLAKDDSVQILYGDEVDALYSYINQYYATHIVPKAIIVPSILDKDILEDLLGCRVIIPKSGAKNDLVALVANNAIHAMEQKLLGSKKYEDSALMVEELSRILNIKYPYRIELFDISHLGGNNLVAGNVVYINGNKSKKDYRKYKLTNVDAFNDLASMKEVLHRRLYRSLTKELPLMDLLIVDGGMNQIEIAKEVASSMKLDIDIVGLAKNDKHQTRALVDIHGNEIEIDRTSSLFFFLMKMQDEVHRYAITYQKSTRTKSLTSSILDNVPGLGKKRKDMLLKVFKTIDVLKTTSVEELSQYIPTNVAIELKKILEN